MEKQSYMVSDCIEKMCETCGEERGHVVVSVTKKGQISSVSCPKCGTRSRFKQGSIVSGEKSHGRSGAPYDPTRTYRAGQLMQHPTFGLGEVTAVIEPKKIDVLFEDRLRRLIHSHT